MKKFKGVSDVDLFFLWKKKDPDAEAELIERYRAFSVGLADQLLDEFKNVTKSEKDDLIGIGLYCLFIALKRFRGGKYFYPYWEKIAKHRMMDDIKENSYSFQNMNIAAVLYRPFFRFDEEVDSTGFSSGLPDDRLFVWNQLISILSIEKLKLKDEDKEMFLLYVQGYRYDEIAGICNKSYSTVWNRITKVKEKLNKIFFNS